MTDSFSIPRLISGGLITNYNCTSRCRHCLYNCSPARSKAYIDPQKAYFLFRTAVKMGAGSMHIGGGEPILAPEKLRTVLEQADRAGIHIDYVETNSSWYENHEKACSTLISLKEKGLSTLLISISPFHLEFVPFYKVAGVIKACQETGVQPFIWMDSFIQDCLKFDTKKPHRFETLTGRFGDGYLNSIQQRYWIHMGGRAIKTFRPLYPKKTVDRILSESGGNCCRQLCETSHFHFDLKGNYIPGLCAGFGIKADHLDQPITEKQYPLISILAKGGIRQLHVYAKKEHGFKGEGRTYINQCDLCNNIRFFLVHKGCAFSELTPKGYYTQSGLEQ